MTYFKNFLNKKSFQPFVLVQTSDLRSLTNTRADENDKTEIESDLASIWRLFSDNSVKRFRSTNIQVTKG